MKKFSVKNVLMLILALSMILPLASCGGKNPSEAEETTAETEEVVQVGEGEGYTLVENDFSVEVRRHLSSIPTHKYDGAVFLIATPAPALFNEDETSVVMGSAIEYRNQLVENKLGVSISTKYYDEDTLYTMALHADMAGDYFADAIMMSQKNIGKYAKSGMLFNLNSLPFADYSAGYNIKSGTAAAMAASDGYALAGWATLDPDTLPCIFFNKDIIEAVGLQSPYELVREGLWTWDKFFEYTSAVPSINEALGTAVYSWGTQNSGLTMADIVYASHGNSFISGGLGNKAEVILDAETSLAAVTNGKKLYSEPSKNLDSMSALDTFANGGSLFLIDKMGSMKTLASSKAVWGILPMPKGSAEQESYYSLAPFDSLFFGVLSSAKNAEQTSLVLSSLNAASLGFMVDAYVTNAMTYYLRDNASCEMVEKVCYGVTYDMAYSFGQTDMNISNGTYFGLRNVYEMNHDINFYINRYKKNANKALAKFFPQ